MKGSLRLSGDYWQKQSHLKDSKQNPHTPLADVPVADGRLSRGPLLSCGRRLALDWRLAAMDNIKTVLAVSSKFPGPVSLQKAIH